MAVIFSSRSDAAIDPTDPPAVPPPAQQEAPSIHVPAPPIARKRKRQIR